MFRNTRGEKGRVLWTPNCLGRVRWRKRNFCTFKFNTVLTLKLHIIKHTKVWEKFYLRFDFTDLLAFAQYMQYVCTTPYIVLLAGKMSLRCLNKIYFSREYFVPENDECTRELIMIYNYCIHHHRKYQKCMYLFIITFMKFFMMFGFITFDDFEFKSHNGYVALSAEKSRRSRRCGYHFILFVSRTTKITHPQLRGSWFHQLYLAWTDIPS